MPRQGRLSRLRSEEAGFSLPEILVVIMIIGLLAAIGYATLLGQRTKASDADAKDAAAALVMQVKSCHVPSADYTKCDDAIPAELGDTGLRMDTSATLTDNCDVDLPSGLPDPPDNGTVAVVASGPDCFVVVSTSNDGHYFWTRHRADAPPERGCAPDGQGGCHVGGTWSSEN